MRTFLDFDTIYALIETQGQAIIEQLQEELENVEDGSLDRKSSSPVQSGYICLPVPTWALRPAPVHAGAPRGEGFPSPVRNNGRSLPRRPTGRTP